MPNKIGCMHIIFFLGGGGICGENVELYAINTFLASSIVCNKIECFLKNSILQEGCEIFEFITFMISK
jgi:hypothetical protein